MYFQTFSKQECCACTACVLSCPKACITLKPDEEGFLYPEIDKGVCIDCGLCERVCPVEHPIYSNRENPATFAAMLKDVNQRKQSSSGGLFYAIAGWIVQQGGKVYGATIDDELQVKHIGVEHMEDLRLLRGSKYVQSDLQDVFVDVKQELISGRWCYFVGTPCQVAGLKSYLRKDYEKLLTSDLVCHGVPSQWLFNQHIDYLEKTYKGKISGYQFRNNGGWGVCEIFNLTTPKGKSKYYSFPSYILSSYLYSFMYAMTYRHSCYDCKFARIPRQGDITLADYWGVKEFFPDMDASAGVSLILANTAKGSDIIGHISEEVILKESKIRDGSKYNGNLVKVSKKSEYRDKVYEMIQKKGYKSVATNEFRADNYWKIRCLNTLSQTYLWRILKVLKAVLLK